MQEVAGGSRCLCAKTCWNRCAGRRCSSQGPSFLVVDGALAARRAWEVSKARTALYPLSVN